MSWTPEREEKLKALAEKKLSATVIAAELGGCTRNAVIGKLTRLGIKWIPHGTRSHASIRMHERKQRKKRESILDDLFVPVELPPDQSDFAVSFFDVKPGQCRYPLGDSRDLATFRYCGAETLHEHSWCARHARIVYTKPRETDEAAKELRRRRAYKMRRAA